MESCVKYTLVNRVKEEKLMSSILVTSATAATGTTSGAGGWIGMVLWMVILFAFMYFVMIRPQKKEAQKKDMMLNELAVGDTVLTTSGFYGVVIDLTEDDVIVEFGSNRNCRIPMKKAAIQEVEKQN